MDISPLAGKPAPREMLVDLSRLGSFTEAHILAITQAKGAGFKIQRTGRSERLNRPLADRVALKLRNRCQNMDVELGGMRIINRNKVNPLLKKRRNERNVAGEPIQLRDDQTRPSLLGSWS